MSKFKDNQESQNQRWEENSHLCAIDFDYNELDKSPIFEGDFGECLKNAINSYMTKKLFQMLLVFNSLSEEERKVLIAVMIDRKSFRQIQKEEIVKRDKNTIQERYQSAIQKIKNSPLVSIELDSKSGN